MDITRPRLSGTARIVFRFLCLHSAMEFSQRELAGRCRISPTAAGRTVSVLKRMKLARTRKVGRSILVSLDREHARDMKRIENLCMLYESGLVKEIAKPGEAVVLFGSYSRGDDAYFGPGDGRNSDIDIAIFGPERKLELGKFEKLLKRRINVMFVRESLPRELAESIANGIVLGGVVGLEDLGNS